MYPEALNDCVLSVSKTIFATSHAGGDNDLAVRPTFYTEPFERWQARC